MKAMIFAAGLGTRLKPLTDSLPKALIPVHGKPLLQSLLERLAAFGFDDIVINVHHFADLIEKQTPKFIEEIAQQTGKHMKVCFSDERKMLLETGGGIKHATALLNDADYFLIHNVDILSNVDLTAFCQHEKDADAVLLVSERTTQRYLLFDNTMRLVGWTNAKTGEVKSPIPNLNPSLYHKFAFAGIHLMHTHLLPLMDAWEDKFSIIDFYLAICAEKNVRGYVQDGLTLVDVGKLDTLAMLERGR